MYSKIAKTVSIVSKWSAKRYKSTVSFDLQAARHNSDVADLVDIEMSSYDNELKLISGWGSPNQVLYNKKFKRINMIKIRELDFNCHLQINTSHLEIQLICYFELYLYQFYLFLQ